MASYALESVLDTQSSADCSTDHNAGENNQHILRAERGLQSDDQHNETQSVHCRGSQSRIQPIAEKCSQRTADEHRDDVNDGANHGQIVR